jgi:hypothetical protein
MLLCKIGFTAEMVEELRAAVPYALDHGPGTAEDPLPRLALFLLRQKALVV